MVGMDTKRAQSEGTGSVRVLLTVIAVMLGILVLDRVEERGLRGGGSAAYASGQPETAGALVSAADQRKQIIAELRTMSQRLDAVEKRLAKPLQVKVLEMPVQKERPATERAGS